LKAKILYTLFLVLELLFLSSTTLLAAEPVKIAVLAFRPKAETMAKWRPLETFINSKIPDYQFELETFNYHELEAAIANNEVDFVLTQPAHYILMTHKNNLSSPLATLVKKKGEYKLFKFGGVIFTRADRTDISGLIDIKKKTIAVPAIESLGAYQMQAMELNLAKVNLKKDIKIIETGMPHDKAVTAVLNQQADVGFVRTGVLESLEKEGKLNLAQLKIINKHAEHGNFPFMHSTELYPEWAFAALPHVNSHISRQVAATLFNLPHQGEVAESIGIVGFTIPADYESVRNLLSKLRLPPYDAVPEFTIIDIWKKYTETILLIIFGLGSFIFALLLNQKFKNARNSLFQHAFNNHKSMIILIDADKKQVKGINKSASKFLGYSEKKAIAMPVADLFPNYLYDKNSTTSHAILADGCFKTVQIQNSEITFNKANLELFIFQDITDSVQIKLRNTLHTLVMQKLVEGVSLKVILTLLLNTIEEHNPSLLCSFLLISADGKHLLPGAAPSLPDFYNEAIDNLEIGDGVGSCGTAAFTRKRVIVEDIMTHPYWAPFVELASKAGLGSCWSEPIFGADNTLLGTLAIYHSEASSPSIEDLQLIEYVTLITAIAIERSQSIEQQKLSSRVFIDTHEGITITDANKNIIEVNPAFCEITGYTREEAIGKNPGFISSGKQSKAFYQAMWQSLNDSGYWKGEVWNRKKTGELYAELLSISSLKNSDEEIVNYVGMFSDITQSKKQQDRLNLLAHYDVLTNLPNRTLFVDRFNQAIAHSKRSNTQLAVCFLDLDNFKPVNDNYGHEAGDQLLIQVSERIKACLRVEDTISRQGGDEFALLLSDINSYAECENTLARILGALDKPYLINDVEHRVTASCGVTLYPNDEGDIDTLLRHADQAMYDAKQSGRNKYHLFNTVYDQETIQKHQQLDEISHALANNEFILYYQPKVSMKTGEVYGAEALIRWIHPERGLVPPLTFLPLIDDTELEIQIGDWVLCQAMQQLDSWQSQGIKLEVSVNIAPHHLQTIHFIDRLEAILAQYPHIESKYLQLEILESSVLGDVSIISNIIKTCKHALGVSVALDDFGTGYSSLTHLRNLPANIIKIDQSFVRDILDDPNDFTIIDGIIKLSESFNREVIAEGVESISHGLVLLNMGCFLAQGYGIAKPMPAEKLADWLKAYEVNTTWSAYANQDYSYEEKKIDFIQLTCKRWQIKFIEKVLSPLGSTVNWPLMDSRKCHCGHWIKNVKKEVIFDPEWINQLDEAHELVHSLAKGMRDEYEHNQHEYTKQDLAEINKAFDDLSLVTRNYKKLTGKVWASKYDLGVY